MQEHDNSLNITVDKLSEEASYTKLFHSYREGETLPSGKALREVVELCRSILFPGYFGKARINAETLRYHIGVHVETLHTQLSRQIYAGLCFSDTHCESCTDRSRNEKAAQLAETFIATLPAMRDILATDAEATYRNDPAAQSPAEVIICYPGFQAIVNYRIAHELYKLGIPFIPRMIAEMAHSDTGIDIHPGAVIGDHFSIDHGTGTVIGETSVIGNHVRIFQGVSLAGEKLPPDENGNTVRGVTRHPILEDYVTVYSNTTLIGPIRIGRGATVCGNVWVTSDIPAGQMVKQWTK